MTLKFPSSDRLGLLRRALFGTTTLVGASVLCLSVAFLLRNESALKQQFGLRAEEVANALASQSQFALLVGDTAELKRMADVGAAGRESVLYIVIEDATGKSMAAAHRSTLLPRDIPAGAGTAGLAGTREVSLGQAPGLEALEASAPVIARPGPGVFGQSAEPDVLGRIRVGMSLESRRAMLHGMLWYMVTISVLVLLVAFLIEYSRFRQRLAAAKIRAAEDRLRFVVNLSPSVLYTCAATAQAPVTFVADTVRGVLGYSPEDFAQPSFFWDHLHPEDRPGVEAILAELLETGQSTAEYRFLHDNGSYRWIENRARIVFDSKRQPLEIIGSLFDINEKMQAREALASSELRYRELTEMLPQTIFECDLTGRLRMANRTGMELFGLSLEDLDQGLSILDLVVPEQRARAAERLQKSAQGRTLSTNEYTLRSKNGTLFPAVVYASPILSGGRPIGIRGLLIDISDQKRAEKELREWALLLESSNDAIIKVDGSSIVYWNSGAQRIYGYSPEEMLGHSIAETVPLDRGAEVYDLLARLEKGEAITSFYTERIRKDGTRIDVSLALTPVRDSAGCITGAFGTVRDITEIKQKQRELVKRNALLELLQASAVAANEAASIEQATQICLDRICSHTGWRVGHAFLRSAGPRSPLRSTSLWYLDEADRFERFRAVTEQMTVEPGIGLPGRVLESGSPCWIADLASDTGVARGKLAAELGLKAAFASPLLAGSEVAGVLEFFSSSAPEADDPFLQVISSVGVQLGRVVERGRASEAIQESEARYRAITENAAHGILTMDERCRILYANGTSAALFGCTSDQLIGRSAHELMPRLDCQDLLAAAAPSTDRFSLPPFESVGLHQGLLEMPLEISISGYLSKDNRRVRTAILRDVSERKRAEEAVEKAHQAIRAVIENSPLAIVTLDLNSRVLTWNTAAEKMFGWSSAEVAGHPLPNLPEGLALPGSERMQQVLAGEVVAFESRRRRKDGSWLEVGVFGGPIRGSGDSVSGVVVEYVDLTERKALEAQLRQAQKLESIGQLAAGLAHEINTPIQYVGDNLRFLKEEFEGLNRLFEANASLLAAGGPGTIGADQLLELQTAVAETDLGYLTDEIPKALQQSLEGLGRVAQILRAMKEFSHPGPAERTAIDLNRAIESTVLVCRNEWKYVADVVTQFDPDLPMVPCLPGEINQVILNLIINAAHAISDAVQGSGGRGSITVSTQRDGAWVEVRVRDSGTGIPENIRDRVFDPFFTTKPVGRGTGQGLALAHAVVVNKHSGSIRFETEAGVGTVFIVRLPLGGCGE